MDRARQVAQVRLRGQVLLDHLGQGLCFPGDVALAAAAAGVEGALHVLEHGQGDLLVFVGLLGVLDVRVGHLGGMDGLAVLTLGVVGRLADSGVSKVGLFYPCSSTYLRYIMDARKGLPMKRSVLYMRVSTLDQHPETQMYDLHQMAEQRGYQIVEEYEDRISGAKARRPGLDAMMRDARRGQFDVVLGLGL